MTRKSGLSIVFAGTPKFGLPCLNALIQSQHTVKAVYTQPDRPSGRGRKIQACAIKEWAVNHEIPVYQPINFKSPETRTELACLKPDLMIVIAYGLILPQSVLEIPALGCINVHASLLPRWRGASPIQQAILHGDAVSGITLMQMDAGMDTGDILSQTQCTIDPLDTAESLHDRLAQIAVKPLLMTLDKLVNQQVSRHPQDNKQATYASKINKDQACINWNLAAQVIDRQIRAFNPWPVAYTMLDEQPIRIHEARCVAINNTALPGTILSLDKKGLLIATAEDSLLITKIQMPGAKIISIADWMNSGKTQLHPGLVLQ